MRKYLNKVFIYLIFFSIVFIYAVNVKIVWIDMVENSPAQIAYILSFTSITALLVWALLKTMLTDPGRVPQNWGFFLDGTEQKKRRLCLICHIFKPERCHHCSACNRCVLNMDHHCPWILNCVGFHNRKYFMQMLFYVILDSFMASLGLIKGLLLEAANIQSYLAGKGEAHILNGFLIFCGFALSSLAFVMISKFFYFHLELVLTNKTTIENLEKKRNEESGQTNMELNQYDLAPYYNWVQVFGTNKLLWFFPISTESGRPAGDGILWPKKHQLESENTKELVVISPDANKVVITPQVTEWRQQSNAVFSQQQQPIYQSYKSPQTQPFQ